MIPYIGEECAKTHTHGSTDRVKVICPDCGRTKIKSIMTIDLLKSIACSCSDGNSYISKYIFNILNQLQENRQLEEINTEIKYNWCKFYNPFKQKDTYGIYDFVIECKKIIIEADGEFHRKDNKMNGQSKEESEWLDNIKDNLANKHGYKIIRISDEGNIKENILESDLNKLFDLSKIDWLKCNLFATSNLVKVACEYKKNNPSMTTIEIANIMGYCQCSVINWLKKGCKFNWCYYNAKEEQQKSKIGKKIKCIEDGMFFNSITEASIYYSIEDSSISAVCNGKRKTAGKRKFEFTA
jgi:very-short-patch-repair endonuclease